MKFQIQIPPTPLYKGGERTVSLFWKIGVFVPPFTKGNERLAHSGKSAYLFPPLQGEWTVSPFWKIGVFVPPFTKGNERLAHSGKSAYLFPPLQRGMNV